MALSTLKIIFNQNLIIGSTVAFNIKQVSTGIETPYTFTWVASRTNPYEVTYITPYPTFRGRSSAEAFEIAFNLDFSTGYPTDLQISRQVSNLLITSNDEDYIFTGGTATYQPGVASPIIFETNRNDGILLTGIESDNYLINNEVWVELSVNEVITRYSVSLTNMNNGKFTQPFVLFSNNGYAKVNLQPILKSIFDYPNVRNQNKFQIDVTAYNGNTIVHTASVVKNFIRGGNRTDQTNQNLTIGTILRPSIKLPIWDTYPTDQYFLDVDGSIQITTFSEIPTDLKDYKRVKGCNGIYFKFLNQMGGYSNWLFESHSEPETNANLGAYVRNNQIEDLGNEVDNSLNVYSKVPKEYYRLVQDLFISPEIYVWQDMEWRRVLSAKNTSEYEPIKRAYSVKGKFDYENRFNPSLLWSN